MHNTFWSVLTSIISKKVYSLGSKDASCTLNEYNSVSAESVLSVHTPIINLTSSMEFSTGNFSLFALAYSIIACWSIVNILSVLLGRRMKSAFVAVGKLPSTLTIIYILCIIIILIYIYINIIEIKHSLLW